MILEKEMYNINGLSKAIRYYNIEKNRVVGKKLCFYISNNKFWKWNYFNNGEFIKRSFRLGGLNEIIDNRYFL